MPSLGDTVEVQVVDDIVETLEAIHSASGDYNTDPERVYEMYGNVMELPELPGIVVAPMRSERNHDCPNGAQRVDLKLSIACVVAVDPSFEAARDDRVRITHFANDVEKALRADHSRGSLAIDTHIDSVDIFELVQGNPLAVAEVSVTVPFRFLNADPTQAI